MDVLTAQSPQRILSYSKPLTMLRNLLSLMGLKWWLSWREQTGQVLSFVPTLTKESTDLKSYNIYHSADKCPFTVFEDCLIDNNLQSLGNAPDHVLKQAWEHIYSDYIKLIDDGTGLSHIQQVARIHFLQAKIDRVKGLCDEMVTLYNILPESVANDVIEPLYDALNESGYKVKGIEDLNKVVAYIKREEVSLRMMINNLPKDSQDVKDKVDRAYFDSVLIGIEEIMKIPISKDNLTVSKYCAYVQRARKYIEHQNKK